MGGNRILLGGQEVKIGVIAKYFGKDSDFFSNPGGRASRLADEEGKGCGNERVEKVDGIVAKYPFAFEEGAEGGVGEIADRAGKADQDEGPGIPVGGERARGCEDPRPGDADA